jgi:hypothetical protein
MTSSGEPGLKAAFDALTARIDAIMNDASFTPQNLTHSRHAKTTLPVINLRSDPEPPEDFVRGRAKQIRWLVHSDAQPV